VKTSPGTDPYAVNSAFLINKVYWEKYKINSSLFNSNRIRNAFQGLQNKRNSLFFALSQAYYYNENFST
jgi:hypothetical protein